MRCIRERVLPLLIALTLSHPTITEACRYGWFGPQCQYKCHCKSRVCDSDGKCSGGVCNIGWFGPECQYLDLASIGQNNPTPAWLIDADDSTCNTGDKFEPVVARAEHSFIFTWLRLRVNDPTMLMKIQPFFSDKIGVLNIPCANIIKAKIDETTIDIKCELNNPIQYVILKGDGLHTICSLYISGGRNVALKQVTNQSSTYNEYIETEVVSAPENAVDGNTDPHWELGSCSGTDAGDENPSWRVTLSSERYVNMYVIYNQNANLNEMKGFRLTSFTKDLQIILDYNDYETEGLIKYIIVDKPRTNQFCQMVVIQIVEKVTNPILRICEVELYGDSVCKSNMYGRDCEHTCNCAVKNESCFVSTGACPSGCPDGYQGENCKQPCGFGTYGKGCALKCSSHCSQFKTYTPCRNVDGECLYGCVNWYKPPKCDFKTFVFSNIKLIGIVITVIVIVVMICLLVAICFVKRRKKQSQASQSHKSEDAVTSEVAHE